MKLMRKVIGSVWYVTLNKSKQNENQKHRVQ